MEPPTDYFPVIGEEIKTRAKQGPIPKPKKQYVSLHIKASNPPPRNPSEENLIPDPNKRSTERIPIIVYSWKNDNKISNKKKTSNALNTPLNLQNFDTPGGDSQVEDSSIKYQSRVSHYQHDAMGPSSFMRDHPQQFKTLNQKEYNQMGITHKPVQRQRAFQAATKRQFKHSSDFSVGAAVFMNDGVAKFYNTRVSPDQSNYSGFSGSPELHVVGHNGPRSFLNVTQQSKQSKADSKVSRKQHNQTMLHFPPVSQNWEKSLRDHLSLMKNSERKRGGQSMLQKTHHVVPLPQELVQHSRSKSIMMETDALKKDDRTSMDKFDKLADIESRNPLNVSTSKFKFLDQNDTRELRNVLGSQIINSIFMDKSRDHRRFNTQISQNYRFLEEDEDKSELSQQFSNSLIRKKNNQSMFESSYTLERSQVELKVMRQKRLDALNPQNNLSKLSFQQKILGHASKVNFNIKPQDIKANRITMESWKAPVESKHSRIIERIIDNYRQERDAKATSLHSGTRLISSKLTKKMKKFNKTQRIQNIATSLRTSQTHYAKESSQEKVPTTSRKQLNDSSMNQLPEYELEERQERLQAMQDKPDDVPSIDDTRPMQPLSGLTEEVPMATNVNLHTFNHSNSSGILRVIEDPLRLGNGPVVGGKLGLANRKGSKNLRLPKQKVVAHLDSISSAHLPKNLINPPNAQHLVHAHQNSTRVIDTLNPKDSNHNPSTKQPSIGNFQNAGSAINFPTIDQNTHSTRNLDNQDSVMRLSNTDHQEDFNLSTHVSGHHQFIPQMEIIRRPPLPVRNSPLIASKLLKQYLIQTMENRSQMMSFPNNIPTQSVVTSQSNQQQAANPSQQMSMVKIPQISSTYQPASTNLTKAPSKSGFQIETKVQHIHHRSPPVLQMSNLQLNLQSSNHSSRELLGSPYGIEDKHPKDMFDNFEHFRQLLSKNQHAPKAETHLTANRNVQGGYVTFNVKHPEQLTYYSNKNPNRSPQHLQSTSAVPNATGVSIPMSTTNSNKRIRHGGQSSPRLEDTKDLGVRGFQIQSPMNRPIYNHPFLADSSKQLELSGGMSGALNASGMIKGSNPQSSKVSVDMNMKIFDSGALSGAVGKSGRKRQKQYSKQKKSPARDYFEGDLKQTRHLSLKRSSLHRAYEEKRRTQRVDSPSKDESGPSP